MKKFLHTKWSRCMLAICAILLTQSSFAQVGLFNKAELGLTIAPNNFLGDLGGNVGKGTGFLKDNNFSQTRIFIGAHLTVYPAEWLGFRLQANYGTISGDDAIITGKGGYEEARKVRNSDFKSKIAELFLAAEVYPTVFLEEDPSDLYHKLRPYGLIGVGVFHFNPQGTDPVSGGWVNLQPLSTEGQGFSAYPDRQPYKLTQMNIPMGFGIKYFASDVVSISLEIIHRKTFTDYIDDVSTDYIDPALFSQNFGAGSQKAALATRMANKSVGTPSIPTYVAGDKRGTPTNKDAYYSAGFKLSFIIGGGDRSYRNSTRCPTLRY